MMGTPKMERLFLCVFTCFLCTFGGVQEATTTHQSSVKASCDIETTMETAHCFSPTYEANKENDYNTTYSIEETDSGKVSDGTLCVLNSGYPKAIKCQGGEWITSKIPGHITEMLSTAMDNKLLERQKRLTSDLCPVGSYSRDGREPHCELCPLGTYQSYRGQTSCDKCLPGWITVERGATSNLKCRRGECQNPYNSDVDTSEGKLMKFKCPGGFAHGASCSLSCSDGNKVKGNVHSITCEKIGDSEFKWSSHGNVKPICQDKQCAFPMKPEHGFKSCDLVSGRTICSIQCDAGYALPSIDGTEGHGGYYCDNGVGQWIPALIEKESCKRGSPVSGHFLRGSFYYDTIWSTCKHSVDAMKGKFTQAANDSSILNGTCTAGNAKCELTKINVTCDLRNGNISYEAKFTITVTPENPNSFSVNNWKTLGKNIETKFSQNVYGGKYDLINVFSGLFTVNLQCDGARQVRLSDPNLPPLCVPCGKGYFFNGSTTLCHACPLGTYQPDEEARICKTCPGNSTTNHTASKDLSNCLDLCPVGSYSRDGREPHCELCHLGTYQSNRGQTSCDECPPGWITDERGATSNLQCRNTDLCAAKSCGAHGTCTNQGFFRGKCQCDAHWSGDKCELQTPPDVCSGHHCANGATCENVFEKGVPTYRCLCAEGFRGNLCREAIVHGGWGSWLEWSQCSKSCPGTQSRHRVCDSPPPGPEGRPCEEPSTESIECNVNCSAIPVDGQLTQWSPWQCPVTCGDGIATRKRSCTPPKNGGRDCSGDVMDSKNCVLSPCPIDGGYTEFGPWSECSKSCGKGQRARSRSCSNPMPSHGGRNCERLGPKDERHPCKVQECSSAPVCTPGTYLSNNSCRLCPRDQYQDQNGQNNCIPCPNGTSAEDIGSHSIDQCKAAPSKVGNGGKMLGGKLLVLLIGSLGVMFFGAVFAVWFKSSKVSSQRSSTPNRAIRVDPWPNYEYPRTPHQITDNQVAPPAD